MSQRTTTIDGTRRNNGVRPYPRMLPQWVLEICRPIVYVICKLLWRVQWVNTEHIPENGGLIIASNHQTYIDPFWISYPVKRPVRYLAWDAKTERVTNDEEANRLLTYQYREPWKLA